MPLGLIIYPSIVTTNQTLENGYDVYAVNCDTQSVTITLANDPDGQVYFIKRQDTNVNNVLTVSAENLIDGLNTKLVKIGEILKIIMFNNTWISIGAAMDGITGATGSIGQNGETGATGSTGSAGNTGAAGPTGATGTMGSIGATGATGATGDSGPPGSDGAFGATGATGATGSTGATGALGSTGATGLGLTGATGPGSIFTSAGLVSAPKIWIGSTGTNGSGVFTVNTSSAGFSSVTSAQATAFMASSSAATAPFTSLQTFTTTSVSGICLESAAVLIGGEALTNSGSGVTVYVCVFGT